MAANYWIGTDGVWSTNGNWSSGTAPAASGTAVLDGTYSDFPITSGFAQGAVDLALLFINENYTADVASAGDPLVINADLVVHLGGGGLNISNDGTGKTIDKMIINTAGNDASNTVKGGNITMLAVTRGNVELIDVDATMADLILSQDQDIFGANVKVLSTSTAITNIKMDGGRLTLAGAADVGKIIMSQGVLTNESSSLSSTELHQFNGSTNWNTAVTLSFAAIMAGRLDFTKTSHEKTITKFLLMPDATFEFIPSLTTATPLDLTGESGVSG